MRITRRYNTWSTLLSALLSNLHPAFKLLLPLAFWVHHKITLSKRSETAAYHLHQLLLKKYQAPVSGQKLFGEPYKRSGMTKSLYQLPQLLCQATPRNWQPMLMGQHVWFSRSSCAALEQTGVVSWLFPGWHESHYPSCVCIFRSLVCNQVHYMSLMNLNIGTRVTQKFFLLVTLILRLVFDQLSRI